MNYDLEKFINATLFFAKNVKKLGITKLSKLLYYSDFEHYRLYGRTIIGDSYIRMENGPVPKKSYALFNQNFKYSTSDSLKKVMAVRPDIVSFSGKVDRKTIVAKQKPDLSYFSKSEKEIMERIAFIWKDSTAKVISKQSHLERPWQETVELQDIDYKLALDQPDSISREYAEYREDEDRALEKSLSAL